MSEYLYRREAYVFDGHVGAEPAYRMPVRVVAEATWEAPFTVRNHVLPERDMLPMHCSATVGRDGDVAPYYGLSGTGKTTLGADPPRRLIGDDEHASSDHSVVNFEGGCHAKVIRLAARAEPQIHQAIRIGCVLENVVVDPTTRAIHRNDASLTGSARATCPVSHIPCAVVSGVGGVPRHVFFLTCDASGVLPPIGRLTPAMAGYHFLSGFTAKVAGTEEGVAEPQPTFSASFGAPLMPRDPVLSADTLAERLRGGPTQRWPINTG